MARAVVSRIALIAILGHRVDDVDLETLRRGEQEGAVLQVLDLGVQHLGSGICVMRFECPAATRCR